MHIPEIQSRETQYVKIIFNQQVNFVIATRTLHKINLSNFKIAYITAVYLRKVDISVALEKVFPPKLSSFYPICTLIPH